MSRTSTTSSAPGEACDAQARRKPSNAIERLIADAWVDDALLASRFIRFDANAHPVGWLAPAFAAALRQWPDVFMHESSCVRFVLDLAEGDRCDAMLARVIETLAAQGVIGGWRNELYPVRSVGEERPLLHIERAAARAFGITSDAVHVNGIAIRDGRPSLWIARRSPTKSIDPGMRDNLVGGGVAGGLSVRATLVKEAWEEAGLDASVASTATPGRRLAIRRIVPEGLQLERIFVHDLLLGDAMVPRNQDGEVSGFERLTVEDTIELLQRDRDDPATDPMTVDASLVTLDWLARQRHVMLPDTDACRAVYGR